MAETTDLPHSSSESTAFAQLHPLMQKWVWDQGWGALRDAQEAAVEPILSGTTDVIISAATASGKTEAAFLPICSRLATEPITDSVAVLYISPLKALINDQTDRLENMCERIDLPVTRWHGDVSGTVKQRLIRSPQGMLLITPESLEALLVRRGTQVARMFAHLQFVVIDEMHSFLGLERGRQLQSILGRVEMAIHHRVPRIGLSATLSDFSAAAEYLRPQAPSAVEVIESKDDSQEIQLQVLGYTSTPRHDEEAVQSDTREIASQLFDHLSGSHNLVFANSRQRVEELADVLNRLSNERHVGNQFLPHHGNLSKEVREDVEARLNDSNKATTAVCTSTLELGIDIGTMESVAQVGAPPSVASLRQRLGRAGRRDDAATLRVYVSEPTLDERTPPVDGLRAELVKTVATINLLLQRWYEPPDLGELDYSTLVQQILAVIYQYGGVTAAEAHRLLCGPGPFGHATPGAFEQLLRDMGEKELIMQSADGTLLHGAVGERIANHYEFYTVFVVPQEYRLVADGRTLGTLPVNSPLYDGALLVFAGRRWRVVSVDDQQRVIDLTRATGGAPPMFGGDGAPVNSRVHQEMFDTYKRDDVPLYLNQASRRLLTEGRDNFQRYGLANKTLLDWGDDTVIFHWSGDRVGTTLIVALAQHGIQSTHEGFAVTANKARIQDVRSALRTMRDEERPSAFELAETVQSKASAKYDWVLGPSLMSEAYASRSIDVDGAWRFLYEAKLDQ